MVKMDVNRSPSILSEVSLLWPDDLGAYRAVSIHSPATQPLEECHHDQSVRGHPPGVGHEEVEVAAISAGHG